jgi:hypothetical protein
MVIVSVCSMFLVIQIGLNKRPEKESALDESALDKGKSRFNHTEKDFRNRKQSVRQYDRVSQHDREKEPLSSSGVMLEECI